MNIKGTLYIEMGGRTMVIPLTYLTLTNEVLGNKSTVQVKGSGYGVDVTWQEEMPAESEPREDGDIAIEMTDPYTGASEIDSTDLFGLDD